MTDGGQAAHSLTWDRWARPVPTECDPARPEEQLRECPLPDGTGVTRGRGRPGPARSRCERHAVCGVAAPGGSRRGERGGLLHTRHRPSPTTQALGGVPRLLPPLSPPSPPWPSQSTPCRPCRPQAQPLVQTRAHSRLGPKVSAHGEREAQPQMSRAEGRRPPCGEGGGCTVTRSTPPPVPASSPHQVTQSHVLGPVSRETSAQQGDKVSKPS